MICIFLDDERDPNDVTWVSYNKTDMFFVVVRTFDAFVDQLNLITNFDDVLFSFDHDIQDFKSGTEKTGFTCAMKLVDHFIENNLNPDILHHVVHSKNPIGADKINGYIRSYKAAFKRGIL